ncbi:MAG: hypothetical protein P0Y49_18440 [Candidatus Pedobacter colombiensis]|uniref:DUF2490 domain-containing protein n=1 Tax=Candidatus Pedobacter colombiensis TaxID=3121371 RepID=A0AAJ5W7Z7_9SPHI|nr:hypothetical protein [Pedobacter sp.]WEK18760.1 MAG: hypothetical protein P0Y49_18440 [Pedobacter sp.]
MKKITFSLIFVTCLSSTVFAQISPPGLGRVQAASWFVIALRQGLDSANKKQSVTYLGIGRTSEPTGDGNPFKKQAIFVLNQEFYNHYSKNWQYSYALSYRRQNQYEDIPPYDKASPSIEQEFRVYGRYSYLLSSPRFKWVNTLRQEFRKFFDPNFNKVEENFQLRTRFKTQLTANVDEKKVHRIISSAEALFSVSKDNFPEKSWGKFGYREARFCLYYSVAPTKGPFVFDVGYMNDLLGKGSSIHDAHYIALDIIWENPFGKIKLKKNPANDQLD